MLALLSFTLHLLARVGDGELAGWVSFSSILTNVKEGVWDMGQPLQMTKYIYLYVLCSMYPRLTIISLCPFCPYPFGCPVPFSHIILVLDFTSVLLKRIIVFPLLQTFPSFLDGGLAVVQVATGMGHS